MPTKPCKARVRNFHRNGQSTRRRRSPIPPSAANPYPPRYDENLRALFSGDLLEKRFVHPANDQELIVKTFQDDGWCPVIDDPLPTQPGRNAVQHLRNTVANLNRVLLAEKVRFFTHNRGAAIRWEPVNGKE